MGWWHAVGWATHSRYDSDINLVTPSFVYLLTCPTGHVDRTVRVYGVHPACPKSVLKAAITDAIVKDDTGTCSLTTSLSLLIYLCSTASRTHRRIATTLEQQVQQV